jgi:hypothetical protein
MQDYARKSKSAVSFFGEKRSISRQRSDATVSPFLEGLRIIRVVGGNTAERVSLASARFVLGALGSHGPRTTGSAGRDAQSSVQVAVLGLRAACVVAEMGTTHCGISTLIARVWRRAALCQLRDTAASLLRRHS